MIKNVLEYLEQSAAGQCAESGCGTAKGNTGAYRSSGLYGKEL